MRRQSAVWRVVEGETVLLDLSSATYLGINETGSLLWKAIVEGADRDRLVDLLIDTFSLTPDRAAQDVDDFLRNCRARGLIE